MVLRCINVKQHEGATRPDSLPYNCDEEEEGGGDGGHQVKVDQAPPGLEHLEEDLELTGQRVNQDLLLQFIL